MIGRPRGGALLLGGVVLAVLAVVGVALLVLESPAEQRQRRLDERRVDDLRSIANAVDLYWTEEGSLPPDLDSVADWQGLDVETTDPVTGAPYGYTLTGDDSYELCATFATTDPTPEAGTAWRRHGNVWHHPAGEHCFELETDSVTR